jgi:hypothetical protein
VFLKRFKPFFLSDRVKYRRQVQTPQELNAVGSPFKIDKPPLSGIVGAVEIRKSDFCFMSA